MALRELPPAPFNITTSVRHHWELFLRLHPPHLLRKRLERSACYSSCLSSMRVVVMHAPSCCIASPPYMYMCPSSIFSVRPSRRLAASGQLRGCCDVPLVNAWLGRHLAAYGQSCRAALPRRAAEPWIFFALLRVLVSSACLASLAFVRHLCLVRPCLS